MSDESRRMIGSQLEDEEQHTFTERIEIAASELVPHSGREEEPAGQEDDSGDEG
jgi:hypothetical protein